MFIYIHVEKKSWLLGHLLKADYGSLGYFKEGGWQPYYRAEMDRVLDPSTWIRVQILQVKIYSTTSKSTPVTQVRVKKYLLFNVLRSTYKNIEITEEPELFKYFYSYTHIQDATIKKPWTIMITRLT